MKKMEFIIIIIVLDLLILGCFLFPTYTVTYYPNGATGGTVPVDKNRYSSGEFYTILDNPGRLERLGYNFLGWNTKEDGTGITYGADIFLNIEEKDIVLYAQWSDVDIFICGKYNSNICYWMNSERTVLSDTTDYYPQDIYVDDSDVYLTGTKRSDDGGYRIPVYWKNGKVNLLPYENISSYARSIICNNGDIYVAGSDGPAACYWKNGIQTILTDGSVSNLQLVGNDVYAFGLGGDFISTNTSSYDNKYYVKYWKNSNETELSISASNFTEPKGIVDEDGNIFIIWTYSVHVDSSSYPKSVYWKNGKLNDFSDSTILDINIVNDTRYILGDENIWIGDTKIYYDSHSYCAFNIIKK